MPNPLHDLKTICGLTHNQVADIMQKNRLSYTDYLNPNSRRSESALWKQADLFCQTVSMALVTCISRFNVKLDEHIIDTMFPQVKNFCPLQNAPGEHVRDFPAQLQGFCRWMLSDHPDKIRPNHRRTIGIIANIKEQ